MAFCGYLPLVYSGVRVNYLRWFRPQPRPAGVWKEDMVISALALLGRYCWKLVWPAELCGLLRLSH